MPKGFNIDERVREKVRDLLNADESLTGKELKKKVEDCIEGIKYTVRSYQKLKEEARPIIAEIKESNLGNVWSLSSLESYPLSTDATTAILKVVKFQAGHTWLDRVSIRQARWIARLYPYIHSPAALYRASLGYSDYEIYCKLHGKSNCDTSQFDQGLLDGTWERSLKTFKITCHLRYPWEEPEALHKSEVEK